MRSHRTFMVAFFIPMKLILLTQGYSAMVDDEDYEWLNQWKWYAHKQGHTFYVRRSSRRENGKRKAILMHRVILNPTIKLCTDHIDGNGLNNQRKNLRICTKQENGMNRSVHKNNKSGLKGVQSKNGKWAVRITINKKLKYIGCFKDKIDAAKSYDIAALEYHGKFSRLNFPLEAK